MRDDCSMKKLWLLCKNEWVAPEHGGQGATMACVLGHASTSFQDLSQNHHRSRYHP